MLTHIPAADWPTSGSATTGTTGLNALTGTNLVHVGSEDVPSLSRANGYIQGDQDTNITVGVDAFAAAIASSNKYGFGFWVRLAKTGTPVDATNIRWRDLDGNGIRVIFNTWARGTGITMTFSPFTLAGGTIEQLSQLGASAGPVVIPYDRWTYVRVEVDFTVGDFAYLFFVNDQLVARFTGGGTDGNASLSEAVQLTIGADQCTPQICGPFISYNDESEVAQPLRRLHTTSSHLTVDTFGMSWNDTNRGSSWTPTFTGTATATRTQYASSGANPKRFRQILGGAGTVKFASPAVGALPFNASGWCTIAFPMLYLAGSGASTLTVALRNAANDADVVSLTFDGDSVNDTIGGTEPFAHNRISRYALLIHLCDNGEATATLIDQTNSGTSQYLWSARLAAWTPGDAGPIELRATVASGDAPEIDGCFIGRYCDLLGIDSLTASAASSVSPVLYMNNHLTAYLPAQFTDLHNIPGNIGADSSQYSQSPIIVGRPGRGSAGFRLYVTQNMHFTRAVRLVFLDGASINDLTGITDANRASALATWKATRTADVLEAVGRGNRVWLTTMIRRDQGTYSETQLREIDTRNGFIRELANVAQRFVGGQPLIELSDVAYEIDDHATLFTAGDDVHFDTAGDIEYAGLAESLATSSTRHIGIGALTAAEIVDQLNADATHQSLQTNASNAAAQAAAAATQAAAAASQTADIAAEVWDAPYASHIASGTFGQATVEIGADVTALQSSVGTVQTEVNKIPRASSALTAGGDVTRSKQSASANTLVERLS